MSLFEKNERFFAVSNAAVYSLLVLSMSCSESLLETKKTQANKTYFGEVIHDNSNWRKRETTKQPLFCMR